MTRRSTLGLAAAAGALLLLPTAAACGIQPSGIVSLGALPSAVADNGQPSIPPPGSTDYILYFYSSRTGELTPVYRSGTATPSEAEVLAALVQGPTSREKSEGFSALPGGLTAKANADDDRGAYALSNVLTPDGKAEFICTMQNFDQLSSVAIQTADGGLVWNACSDTTGYYVQLTYSTAIPTPGADTGPESLSN